MARVLYLSHPQVTIDPEIPVHESGLNDIGQARVAALAISGALLGIDRVVSSAEVKALETALPLASALGLNVETRPHMRENDRSSTGFLPGPEFEATADQFFAHPDTSVRGWETACAAQQRIMFELNEVLTSDATKDTLIVGHGAVGTLIICALLETPISREHDQGPGGGGNWFAFNAETRSLEGGWRPMEGLL